MIHDLKVLELMICCAVWAACIFAWIEDAISLNRKLQMEYGRVEVGVLVPSSLKQGFLETAILLTDENLGFLFQSMLLPVQMPIRWILDFQFVIIAYFVIHTYFLSMCSKSFLQRLKCFRLRWIRSVSACAVHILPLCCCFSFSQ